jgi:hypothetical protein
MAGVRLEGSGHFIPLLERHEGRLHIGDPLEGDEWLTTEALLERYEFTGFQLRIGR